MAESQKSIRSIPFCTFCQNITECLFREGDRRLVMREQLCAGTSNSLTTFAIYLRILVKQFPKEFLFTSTYNDLSSSQSSPPSSNRHPPGTRDTLRMILSFTLSPLLCYRPATFRTVVSTDQLPVFWGDSLLLVVPFSLRSMALFSRSMTYSPLAIQEFYIFCCLLFMYY